MYGQNHWRPYAGSSVSPAFAMVDGAVVKAHSDLLATGQSISTWSVANAALLMLNAVSFESLGFNMQSIPPLNRLMLTEVKVNSFIHCFAGVQDISSVRDLEMAICEREGVTNFEELGLGPILKHPLVLHYFSSQIATASQTSTAAQMPRLWPDRIAPLEGKQGSKIKLSEINFCTKFAIHKTPKLWMVGIKFKPEFQSLDFETGFKDDNAIDGHTWRFIQIWRYPCEKEEDVVGMIDVYHGNMKPHKKRKALKKMITSYPHVGLLNVAIASIKLGLWDRMSSFQENAFAADVNTEVEPADKNTLIPNKHVLEGICLENVLKYVKAYFVSSNNFPDNVTSYPRKQMIILREICKLEYSLTEYLSVMILKPLVLEIFSHS